VDLTADRRCDVGHVVTSASASPQLNLGDQLAHVSSLGDGVAPDLITEAGAAWTGGGLEPAKSYFCKLVVANRRNLGAVSLSSRESRAPAAAAVVTAAWAGFIV
jgi:hypothetical protein